MRVKLITLTAFLSLFVGVTLAFAYGEDVSDDVAQTHETGEVLVVEAVTLKNEIKEQLEALREQKRLEAERLAEQKRIEAELLAEQKRIEAQLVIHQARIEAQERAEQLRQEELNYSTFISEAKSHRFENYDIRKPSKLTGAQLETFIVGTGLQGLGEAYAKAERETGVSAVVLIGISAHESSWGTSRLAVERNNLFGYMAYDSNVGKAKTFKTKEDAIMTVANHLATNYLSEDGKYYTGVTLKAVNHFYASDENWSSSITGILNRIVN